MIRRPRRPLQRTLKPCTQCGRPVREVLLAEPRRRFRRRILVHPDPHGTLQLDLGDRSSVRRVDPPETHEHFRFELHRIDRCEPAAAVSR